jgi:hypothetical protein
MNRQAEWLTLPWTGSSQSPAARTLSSPKVGKEAEMKKRAKKPTKSPSSAKPAISTGTEKKDAKPTNTLGNFRAELPVRYEGVEIGKVSIEFRASETFIPEPKRSIASSPLTQEEVALLTRVLTIGKFFGYLKEVIENDIQIALKNGLTDKSDEILPYLVYQFYYPKDYPLEVSAEATFKTMGYENRTDLIQEEKIFNMVRTEGPLALRQGDVQYALLSWLSNKETASIKMGKLKDALLGHAIGSVTLPFKVGRPRNKASQALSDERIKVIHKEVTKVLKLAKEKAKPLKEDIALYDRTQLGEFIDKAYAEYALSLEKAHDAAPEADGASIMKERIDRLSILKHTPPLTLSPVAVLLGSDKDLKDDFRKLKFEPNKLAKAIVAKLLGMSVSKLEKTLY